MMDVDAMNLEELSEEYGRTLVTKWARNAAKKLEIRRANNLNNSVKLPNSLNRLLKDITPEQLAEIKRRIVK